MSFGKTNSFTKITRPSQNSDLQFLQFYIRLKSMYRACIKGPKTYNTFRGALKIHLDDSSKNFLLKI